MRIIIIDDENASRSLLKAMFTDHHPEIEVIAEADCVETGITLVNNLLPDLIFLDIEMPDGTGFDLLEKIEVQDLHVIFITAHNDYAIKAIKFGALDYLLKPFGKEVLSEAINRAFEEDSKKITKEQLRILKEIIQSRKLPRFIDIPTSKGIQYIPIENIIRLQANGNYTEFFLSGTQAKHMTSQILKNYEERLKVYDQFMRVHKSHIVNLNFVDTYLNEGFLIIKDGAQVPVSKRYRDDLLNRLTNL